jgi:hypothetical protein
MMFPSTTNEKPHGKEQQEKQGMNQIAADLNFLNL